MSLSLGSMNVGEDKTESPAEWRSRLKPVANKWVFWSWWVSMTSEQGCLCLHLCLLLQVCVHTGGKSSCVLILLFSAIWWQRPSFLGRESIFQIAGLWLEKCDHPRWSSSPECPELFLGTILQEGWFPTFVFLLCRDQGGSKKPTDNSQVGTGSPAHKETKPSPLVVPSAKQDSGMKD